jgi:hypothetical protein
VIVVCSGSLVPSEQLSALCDAALRKPLQMDELVHLLRSLGVASATRDETGAAVG